MLEEGIRQKHFIHFRKTPNLAIIFNYLCSYLYGLVKSCDTV